ncbi:MAG TPA: hypothetical protein V6C58_04770 [Allocoleopsis sp.]
MNLTSLTLLNDSEIDYQSLTLAQLESLPLQSDLFIANSTLSKLNEY